MKTPGRGRIPASAVKRRFDIVVLGAGSWGTALAILLARNGHETVVWGRDEAMLAAMVERGSNEKYLPGQRLPDRLAVEPDFTRAVDAAASCLVAVPSHAFGAIAGAFAAMPAAHRGMLWATKGLDPSSGRLLHEMATERLPPASPWACCPGRRSPARWQGVFPPP